MIIRSGIQFNSSTPTVNCPACQQPLPENAIPGCCPSCGQALPPFSTSWKSHLALLLAVMGPAVGTMLIAVIKSPDLTTGWVLIASPIGGLVAGIILSRVMVKSPAARIVAAIVLIPLLALFCLLSSFFGCALVGGGGVRIGG